MDLITQFYAPSQRDVYALVFPSRLAYVANALQNNVGVSAGSQGNPRDRETYLQLKEVGKEAYVLGLPRVEGYVGLFQSSDFLKRKMDGLFATENLRLHVDFSKPQNKLMREAIIAALELSNESYSPNFNFPRVVNSYIKGDPVVLPRASSVITYSPDYVDDGDTDDLDQTPTPDKASMIEITPEDIRKIRGE